MRVGIKKHLFFEVICNSGIKAFKLLDRYLVAILLTIKIEG